VPETSTSLPNLGHARSSRVEGSPGRACHIAVRAPAPALTIGPIEDIGSLQLATPERAVVSVGTDSCEVAWTRITPAGHKPNPADEVAVACDERTGSGITVFVGDGGSFNGPSGIHALAALADAAWVAVSTT
jgi:hypothetical protein